MQHFTALSILVFLLIAHNAVGLTKGASSLTVPEVKTDVSKDTKKIGYFAEENESDENVADRGPGTTVISSELDDKNYVVASPEKQFEQIASESLDDSKEQTMDDDKQTTHEFPSYATLRPSEKLKGVDENESIDRVGN